jgi:hypothetical protein
MSIQPRSEAFARQGDIEAVWERVRERGSYRFSADIVQTTTRHNHHSG